MAEKKLNIFLSTVYVVIYKNKIVKTTLSRLIKECLKNIFLPMKTEKLW